MKITITKRGNRNQFTCNRSDGSRDTANLGPNLWHHDLAHYVVEKQFALTQGFYGKIAAGYSMAQLGDKEIIKTLGSESWTAEILARALQSLSSGACTAEQFPALVNDELERMGIQRMTNITLDLVEELLREFRQFVDQYELLKDGESLELVLN
jgi:hypothetical protein